MENKIPIPTDNIYKFYALFGLVLFVFSIGSILYVVRSTNDIGFQATLEITSVNQIEKPSQVDLVKKQFLQRRLDVALEDRRFCEAALRILASLSIPLILYGFWRWHTKIQPAQDELMELQLKKLRHEVHGLKSHSSEGKS